MKRLFILLLLLSFAGAVWAQDVTTLDDYRGGFENFVEEFPKSLPMNSTVGLNWSDAYIGQLLAVPPSFGVGVTTGVTTIPFRAFDNLFGDLDVDVPSEISNFDAVGIPFPAYAVDGRIGGFVLPFDVGVKFGTLPGGMDVGDASVEYTLFGADVRYAILEQGVVLPDLSVAVGYNRLNGEISVPTGFGRLEIAEVPNDPNNPDSRASIALEEPNLDFDWGANVFDFRAQVSKKVLFIEPHFGLGAALGTADASAGLTTDVLIDEGSGYNEATDATIERLKDAADAAGVSLPDDFDNTGLGVSSNVDTFAFRVFGGASFNILLLRLDLGLMYNITSGSVGGTLGARVQL